MLVPANHGEGRRPLTVDERRRRAVGEELGAAQRPAVDDAAGGEGRLLVRQGDAVGQRVVGMRIGRRRPDPVGIGEIAVTERAPVDLVAAADAVVLGIFERRDDMAAALAEAGAAREPRLIVAIVAALGNAVLELRAQPLKLGIEHEVDDAGDRVGPIGRRCPAGDDVGALHQHRRDEVEVDRALRRTRNEAAAVDEDQGALWCEAAQIERAGADIAGDRDERIFRGLRSPERRQFVQYLGDVGVAPGLNIVLPDHRQRRWRGEARARQSRPGDDDLASARRRLVLRGGRPGRQHRQRRENRIPAHAAKSRGLPANTAMRHHFPLVSSYDSIVRQLS